MTTKRKAKRGRKGYPLPPIKHLLDKGWSHQRIADHLGISKSTVTYAVNRIILDAHLKGEVATVPSSGVSEGRERARAKTASKVLMRTHRGRS